MQNQTAYGMSTSTPEDLDEITMPRLIAISIKVTQQPNHTGHWMKPLLQNFSLGQQYRTLTKSNKTFCWILIDSEKKLWLTKHVDPTVKP